MNKYDKQHQKNLRIIEQQVDALYKEAIDRAVQIGVNLRGFNPSKPFSFTSSAITQKKAEKLVQWLQSGLMQTITGGIHTGWALSNQKNDSIADSFLGQGIPNILKRQYYNHNGDAEQAFIERVTNGMNLSDRVWRYSNEFKKEVELGLDLGIRTGRSAQQMSRDLRIYLQHPDKLFRDVKTKMVDADGNPIWRKSYAAQAYHPGRGVYRSSYKNARRLAVTETNMAYRAADHERWQKMDFVLGQHVLRSTRHSEDGVKDICDELSGANEKDKKGRYPKDFKFTGWHPQCRCFVVPLLADEDEMEKFLEARADGEQYEFKGEEKEPNKEFKDWVKDNTERIKEAERRKTLPIFIKDNKEMFPVAQDAKKKTALDIAKERHANRTPEQIADIEKRAAERQQRMAKQKRLINNTVKLVKNSGYTHFDTSHITELFNRGKWAEAYEEAKALRPQVQALITKTSNSILSVAKKASQDVTKLEEVIASGKYTQMITEARAMAKKLPTYADKIESLGDVIPNVADWNKKFSLNELQGVKTAVQNRLARESFTSLSAEKTFLESEIKWVENHKKYATWEVARDAYKHKLVYVEKKIEIKSIQTATEEALAYSLSTKSKELKSLGEAFRAEMSVGNIDIAKAKKASEDLIKKYESTLRSNAASAKHRNGGERTAYKGKIVHETVDDLKKRLGAKMPKTLENLEYAISEYEKTGKYGAKAKTHKAEIEKLMKELFEQHDLGMNVRDDLLDTILNTHFKNTFEVGTSGGYSGSAKTSGPIEIHHGRLKAAHNLFGMGKDLAKDQLPRKEYEKYGNLLDHDILHSMKNNTATGYGNIEVRFKKDKVFTTWTAGDSLCQKYQPSLVSDPRSCSFDDLFKTPTSSKVQTKDLVKFKRDHISSYLELQYHGDVTPDCVESITFPYDIKISKYLPVAKKWKQTGVKIYYIDGDTLYEL